MHGRHLHSCCDPYAGGCGCYSCSTTDHYMAVRLSTLIAAVAEVGIAASALPLETTSAGILQEIGVGPVRVSSCLLGGCPCLLSDCSMRSHLQQLRTTPLATRVTDGSAGAGGNTLAFFADFAEVVAVENNATRFADLCHNIDLFVSPSNGISGAAFRRSPAAGAEAQATGAAEPIHVRWERRQPQIAVAEAASAGPSLLRPPAEAGAGTVRALSVQAWQSDFVALWPQVARGVVFLDPPWGGLHYSRKDKPLLPDANRSPLASPTSRHNPASELARNIVPSMPSMLAAAIPVPAPIEASPTAVGPTTVTTTTQGTVLAPATFSATTTAMPGTGATTATSTAVPTTPDAAMATSTAPSATLIEDLALGGHSLIDLAIVLGRTCADVIALKVGARAMVNAFAQGRCVTPERSAHGVERRPKPLRVIPAIAPWPRSHSVRLVLLPLYVPFPLSRSCPQTSTLTASRHDWLAWPPPPHPRPSCPAPHRAPATSSDANSCGVCATRRRAAPKKVSAPATGPVWTTTKPTTSKVATGLCNRRTPAK